jgi:hypothetical protein
MTPAQLHLQKTVSAADAVNNFELAIACHVLLGKTIGMWPDEPAAPRLEILRRHGVALDPLKEFTS